MEYLTSVKGGRGTTTLCCTVERAMNSWFYSIDVDLRLSRHTQSAVDGRHESILDEMKNLRKNNDQ
jgi:hypothetical protein